jgi:RHS repeat-associated protein
VNRGRPRVPPEASRCLLSLHLPDRYLYVGSGWINVDDVMFAEAAKETLYYSYGGDTVGMRTGGELHWMFTDHLGSTATTYKADGTEDPVRHYYYPWGNLRGSSEPVVPTDVGYTGQTHDQSTDLMYYRARYYDPTIGRFISADTIVPNPADPQSLNRYSYVANNPVLYTDPTGHCSIAGQQI